MMAPDTRVLMAPASRVLFYVTPENGSKTENGAGAAFYIPELDIRGKFSLQEGISSYSAELIAILQATFTLATIRQKDIIIFSDSQAAITALSNVYNYSKGEGIPFNLYRLNFKAFGNYLITDLVHNQFACHLTGVSLQYLIGSFLPWYWLAFINGCIPTVAFISAFFLPESPQFLINKGRTEEARAALRKVRGASCDVDDELQDLIDFVNKSAAKNATSEPAKTSVLSEVLKPAALKPFTILALYFLLLQFSGLNPVTFYAVEIIQESGANMNKYAATIILGLVRLGFTVISCILMRRLGRRPMTFMSSVGCGLTMVGLGSYMYMGEQWAAEGKEKSATWIPILNLFVFMTASTMGYLTVPWVMIGEVYPSKVRGIMGGLTTFVGHFCIFLVVKTFPLFQSISKFGTFIFYGVVSLLATIFFYLFLPETQGRTLQEIEDYFSGRTKTLGPSKDTTNNNNVKKTSMSGP
ncbi:facilitated trehalose transporter Tret1-like [Homalodisca vitripennis]|uniref:facilitated trehalose transporter Tret1-like n=1 Tax=Homalodisca vitripennis TaxID=197043 RepID=UPI001EEB8E5C|nr:facilitated trehalose transporter Tret1-like [Homalodisca vitripennis]